MIILLSQFGQLPLDLFYQVSSLSLKGRAPRLGKVGSLLEVLVIVHAYWPRQFAEIINRLNCINMPLTIVVTIPEGEHAVAVENLLGTISGHHKVRSMRVENTGRDIGPFLECIEKFTDENWDLVIKVHTKASQNIWFETLLRSLLQSDRRIRRHAQLLKRFPDGLIVHPLFRYPGHKQPIGDPAMHRLRDHLKSHSFSIPKKWYFPAGSMFVIGPKTLMAYRKEIEIMELTKFESEDNYSQRSLAHLHERFLGLYVCTKGSGLFATSVLDFFDAKALLVKII